MPQINKSLARMVADGLEETCAFFFFFGHISTSEPFQAWLIRANFLCGYTTAAVNTAHWMCERV